jgi:hypothetical protein
VVVPYLDPNLDTGGDSGIGDATVSWSFIPYYSISAHPWVPSTLGFLDRVDFGSDQPPQGGFNDTIEANFHFRF